MLPNEIQRFMEQREIRYEILKHSATDSPSRAALVLGINPARVVVANVLQDNRGTLMVMYPANGQLDLQSLNDKLGRRFRILSAQELRLAFPTYFQAQCLPLASLYRMSAEVHDSFATSEPVYFQVHAEALCRISGADFCLLQGPAMYDHFFVKMPSGDTGVNAFQPGRKEMIQERIRKIDSLPGMPTIAQRLLQLSANPYAGARDLAAVIEQDPSLSAQMIRYARSPLYGYSGEIRSIQDVIARVLGFDVVMDMALGVSIGRSFRNPRSGKLGLTEFWRHATYSAVLCQKIGAAVKGPNKPRPGMSYLSGLLHNFGFLLLGHLFPQDFAMLNKAATKYADTPVVELEHTLLGVTHMELGVWLMQAWNMPDEVVYAIREHHNEHYHDVHSVYPNLILIANRLLKEVEMGDEQSNEIPDSMLLSLQLSREELANIFEEVMDVGQGLDYMALQMAA